jgi:hypothetical protein
MICHNDIKSGFKITKTISVGIMISLALVVMGSHAWGASGGQTKDPLLFPKDKFTVETMTVQTSKGVKKVTYRSYMHIPYVANPVDKDYESLNVSVPIKIDDKDVDATNAPILFANGVGGYMSFSNATGGFGMPAGFFPGMNNATQGGQKGGSQGAPQGSAPVEQQGGTQGGMQGAPGGAQGGPGGTGAPAAGGGSAVTGAKAPALAAGYVVVEPGARGRDNKAADGTYYGKAPAAIVDLKAAVRYIKHNKGIIPGNVDWIISSGCSAGGGLSSLLGASGSSHLYDSYLKEIGAADWDDSIFGCAAYSPVADLDHADLSFEYVQGEVPLSTGKLADQGLSKQLKTLFSQYQASLNLKGKNNFGTITADNYDKYLLQYYLIPSANKYLKGLTDEKRKEYLEKHKWIKWSNNGATFTFSDFVATTQRIKGVPAFDDLELTSPETILFGNKTTDARHFTNFTLQQATSDKNAKIDSELQKVVNMMNPMYFIGQNNPGCAKHWWIRAGSTEAGLSVIVANLAAGLENHNRDVDSWLFWDAGHCQDDDTEGFIAWIGKVTGYNK